MEKAYENLLVWQKADRLAYEVKQFSGIALGSLREVEYLLGFCLKLQYLTQKEFEALEQVRKETGALLWRFYKSFCSN